MSAYIVVHGTVKNPDKMKEYGAAAIATFAAFGGKLLSRGPSDTLAGSNPHSLMVLVEFPDKASAKAWYESPAYQALIPLRLAAMDSVLIVGGE